MPSVANAVPPVTVPARVRFAAIVAALVAAPLAALLPAPAAAARDTELEARISALVARMTLAEKVGQLNFPSFSYDSPRAPQLEAVRQGRVGGMLNVVAPRDLRDFIDAAADSRLGIPLLLGIDAIYGFRITFPTPIAWAATWRPELAERAAEAIAGETAQAGINLTFAPMIDVSRDPRWGRVIEGAGEDPLLGAAFAAARVRGYRSGGLATSAKHFVGYGVPEGGRDYNGAQIFTSELFDRHIPPFRAAIEAGAETVMASFNTVNGVPVTADRRLVTDVLRKRLGFDGLVMSDYAAILELIDHGVARDLAQAGRRALRAGIDLDMASRAFERHLEHDVRAGRVPLAEVDAAVRNVLRVKYRMGLFADSPGGARAVPAPPPEAQVRAIAREVARESFVLLENRGSVLPITPGSGTVALIGTAARAVDDLSWYRPAELPQPRTENLVEALAARLGGDRRLRFAEGFADPCGRAFADKAHAIEVARAADLVVLMVAEDCGVSGEGISRTRLGLSGVQQQMLDALAETGRPIVLIVETGRPLALASVAERVAAILVAWHPGTEGRTALAEVLVGEVAPSGKLPMTFPRSVGQIPLAYNDLPTGRPSKGDRYTTGYIDEKASPLYPFGHGLGYTRFDYANLALGAAAMPRGGEIEVRVDVTNAGARPGREVVQLYTRQLVASRSRPVRELKGFAKIALEPGERRTVSFRLRAADLAYHDDDGMPVVEPGPFRVFVGGSSAATLRADFSIVGD
jgi:beta-glucosidase